MDRKADAAHAYGASRCRQRLPPFSEPVGELPPAHKIAKI